MRWLPGVIVVLTVGGGEGEPARIEGPEEGADQAEARARMVQEQLIARGLTDARVLAAMAKVPRHAFVPREVRDEAYEDGPLPIGYGQTISQPYIVALMTTVVEPRPTDRVLEVGTGSGYQAAVLSELVAEVYTIELVEPLARRAEAELARQGCRNVKVRVGDGHRGWPEAAPFDAILVTCAPKEVPPDLVTQLKPGGRMVIPVGSQWGAQELYLLRKGPTGLETQAVLPVRFVPMVKGGEAHSE
jgi:protein-L-isoaspartate(D-aspartate) O-methyltransferase